MSIQSEITRISSNVDAALAAISDKGVDVPDGSNSDSLSSLIGNISTGVELNFEVVGGTVRPANPKENTIWINTDAKIEGWSFGVTSPKNPVEGMVWITTNASSEVEFNALKTNGIQILLVSVAQYIDTQWTKVETMVYQDGTWVQVEREKMLYYYGEEYNDFTGGISIASNNKYSTAVKHTNDIELGCVPYTTFVNRVAVCYATNMLDLTAYKTLYAKADLSLNSVGETEGGIKLFVTNKASNITTLNETGFNALEGTNVQTTGEITLSLDISSRNEKMYIGVSAFNRDAVITEIWME